METIAVLFGGRSAEHDVSIVTALASIIKPLELTKKYRVEAVYIAKDGAWYWDEKLKDIKLFTSGEIQDYLHRTQPTSIQFDGGMTLVKASGIAGRRLADFFYQTAAIVKIGRGRDLFGQAARRRHGSDPQEIVVIRGAGDAAAIGGGFPHAEERHRRVIGKSKLAGHIRPTIQLFW